MNLIASLRQQAISMTDMGTCTAIVWQEIEDVIVEVFADAIGVEYVAKCGDEVFITEDANQFVAALEYALA